MSVTRDKNTGKWMSQIRVKDWTGKEIHKKKRGFKTKKEALQWEQDFISQADGSLGMKFKDFVEIYMKDANPRLRETTLANKHYLFNKKVLPYFGEMPINAIKPTDIRNWQNELINYRRPNGRGYSPTYLRTINNRKLILQKYADEHHFFNTRFFVDDGFSGVSFEREGLQAMLHEVEAGNVATVITKDYCAIIGLNQKDLENQGILA